MSVFDLLNFKKKTKEPKIPPQITVPNQADGVLEIEGDVSELSSAHAFSQSIALTDIPLDEKQKILTYRKLAQSPEIDEAVREVVNEVFNIDGFDPAFTLKWQEDSTTSKVVQEKMHDVMDYIYYNLLDFQKNGTKMFRDWYVDSRYILHKVVDKNGRTIKAVQKLDPLQTRRIRLTEKLTHSSLIDLSKSKIVYYYMPSEVATTNKIKFNTFWVDPTLTTEVIQFADESVAYADSGLIHYTGAYVIGFLDKSIVPYNNMKTMEEAMLINRVVRAPDRRVFKIDVDGIPLSKQESYVNDIMKKYRNNVNYNRETGLVDSKSAVQAMTSDIWLANRSGSNGTDVDTLEGADNTNNLNDIAYSRDNFYKSLGVPFSRLNPEYETNTFGVGRSLELSRDEYRFKKFIDLCRSRFMMLIVDLLKTELILRNIISEDDWDEIKQDFFFEYAEDNSFVELKKHELLNQRLDTLQNASGNIGSLLSPEWALSNILGMQEDEITEMLTKATKWHDNPSEYLTPINTKDTQNSNLKKDDDED